MVLTSIDPFVQEIERQFDRLAQRSFGHGNGAGMPMDGIRRPGEVVLRFDLPGVDPDSIELTVDRGVLSVTATRDEKYGEDEQVFIRERAMGTFTRRVYLSDHLDAPDRRPRTTTASSRCASPWWRRPSPARSRFSGPVPRRPRRSTSTRSAAEPRAEPGCGTAQPGR